MNNCDSAVMTGYGHATFKILSTLPKLDYTVVRDRKADIEITFAHPQFYKFYGERSYKIGYTAWESTSLKPKWDEYLEQIDELWVPNQFCKDVFTEYFSGPIKVFGHGIDDVWQPAKRTVDDKITFIHFGAPAYRKNLYDTFNAFMENFAGNKNVELIIKAYGGSAIPYNEPNVKVVTENLMYPEMSKLMSNAHCFIYPTWGEGFGLLPLQALATGMPVISTTKWMDYSNFLLPEHRINSYLDYSLWQDIHPGKMYRPDYEDVVNKMKNFVDNSPQDVCDVYYDRASEVHNQWNWKKKVGDHFSLVKKEFLERYDQITN